MSSCIHQEAGIYINPEGYVQLCGISKEKVVGDVPPHICDIDDLDRFYRSSYYSLQRSTSVEDNPYCIACTRREANGVKSLRKMIAEKYPKYGIVPDGTIQHLDICFSNLCNQQCLMCKSESSSRWLKDDKRLENTEFNRTPVKYRDWSKEPGNLDKILNILPTVKILTFKGGEPLMQIEVQEMLEYLVEHDLYPRIEILTNFQTTFQPFMMNLLKRSKNLVLRISMDGYGAIYNWTRGGDYNKVLFNIRDYLKGDHKKDLGFTNTLNRWSYSKLPESIFWIQQELREMGVKNDQRINYNIQPVIGPRYTSPFADPLEKRKELVSRFEKFFAKELDEQKGDTIRFGCLNINHVSNVFSLKNELNDEYNTPDLLEKSDKWEQEINRIRGYQKNGRPL